MKEDGDILLELLGEGCCCACEETTNAPKMPGTQPGAEAAAARPQMLGKKIPPLTVVVTDAPFVPPRLPERETPQLPQPGHAPTLSRTTGEFVGAVAPGDITDCP